MKKFNIKNSKDSVDEYTEDSQDTNQETNK